MCIPIHISRFDMRFILSEGFIFARKIHLVRSHTSHAAGLHLSLILKKRKGVKSHWWILSQYDLSILRLIQFLAAKIFSFCYFQKYWIEKPLLSLRPTCWQIYIFHFKITSLLVILVPVWPEIRCTVTCCLKHAGKSGENNVTLLLERMKEYIIWWLKSQKV